MEQAASNNVPIMKNPEIYRVWVSLWMSTFLLIVVSMLGVTLHQQPISLVISQRIFLSIAGSCLAFLIIRLYLRLRLLQFIEHRRQAVARENSSNRTFIQSPSQLEIAPSAITLISNRIFVWSSTLCLLIFAIFFLIPPLIRMFMIADMFVSLYIILFVAGLVIPLFTYAIFSFLKTQRTIEITAHGLQIEKRGDPTIYKMHIDWDEARFFACYTLPNLLPWEKTRYYELSSSTHVVTWISVPEKRSPFTIWKPVLSAQEYRLQMQALCDVITAKTGLALCDLTHSRDAT